MNNFFTISKSLSTNFNNIKIKARCGTLKLQAGEIQTPCFMPVGTKGTVKGLMVEQLLQSKVEILLGNVYHLMLRPGLANIKELGGLHNFMNWDKPILTDSGGYQIMSLAKLRTIDDNGVTFRSHIDGSLHRLTPQKAMQIQNAIGSNIQMTLDECPAFPCSQDELEQAIARSIKWSILCQETFAELKQNDQFFFGILQGSTNIEQRLRHLEIMLKTDFDGFAIGGLAVGEPQAELFKVLSAIEPYLPHDKPRYLMGVGKPQDIIGAVFRGIDMFDCVLPTRSGRHGQAFTKNGAINVNNQKYKLDESPIDLQSSCQASSQYSLAYIHHLFKCHEMLGPILLSWHNVHFYMQLMSDLRKAIINEDIAGFSDEYQACLPDEYC